MTKSPTRESPSQPNEQSLHRNIYDYDGEYEFPIVQHWTAQGIPVPRAKDGRPVASKSLTF